MAQAKGLEVQVVHRLRLGMPQQEDKGVQVMEQVALPEEAAMVALAVVVMATQLAALMAVMVLLRKAILGMGKELQRVNLVLLALRCIAVAAVLVLPAQEALVVGLMVAQMLLQILAAAVAAVVNQDVMAAVAL